MEYSEVLYGVADGIATITLNNPEVLNATSAVMHREWADAICRAGDDDAVEVVVVTGAGRAFCAGRNLRAIARQQTQQERAPGRRRDGAEHDVAEALQGLEKPYIGAINGPAAGGGMDLASQCDIRLASEAARFNMAYIRMGALPSQGGLWTLPRIVGAARALELLWTGRTIDAQEALRIGYVSAVFPQDGFLKRVYEWCRPLVEGPQWAIREDKKLVHRLLGVNNLLDAIRMTDDAARWVRQQRDATEGPRAWLERRAPRFGGEEPPQPSS